MKTSFWAVIGVSVLLVLATSHPSLALWKVLSGVDMQQYCTKTYGSNFTAVLRDAGDWACQNVRVRTDHRPISVQTACEQQNPQQKFWVRAKQHGTAWDCEWEFPERGVDLTLFCTKHFGNDFKAVLHGNTSGDWSCQRGANEGDRRPISVLDACKEQWYNSQNVKAVPPTGWLCILDPQGY